MKKVITYGSYDLLHYGHIRLLERAKALGDYLIVGVTSDDYDKTRGKINTQQSLMERVEAVRQTGLADEIIIEEYEGQKIDDIKRYGIDVFTVGSDWEGYFDYLKEFCEVIYLPRTKGISSSMIRNEKTSISIGIIGDDFIAKKFLNESKYINGLHAEIIEESYFKNISHKYDAFYFITNPLDHYEQIKYALNEGKHVLCESPIALKEDQCRELYDLAKKKNLVLMESIKTAYSTAYNRLVLQVKSGKIGEVLSIDSTCTSMREFINGNLSISSGWNSICAWGPTALLPIFQILGLDYFDCRIISKLSSANATFDDFTKIDFIYKNAVATIKVAKKAKSEGSLIITGTKGYIYVPAPWWKTDYYEIRFENQEDTIKQFYQLDGEGIRNELVSFVRSIKLNCLQNNVNSKISIAIVKMIERFYSRDIKEI